MTTYQGGPPGPPAASVMPPFGIFRAEDYGASSSKDDSSGGINLAIVTAAASGGGVVQLDSGKTYRVRRTVMLLSNVELVIPTGTVLQAAPGLVGDVVASAAGASSGVAITGGGTIDGNRAGGATGNGITLTGISDPWILGVMVMNAYTDGVALVNCTRALVDVTTGANGRHGIYHSGSTFCSGRVIARDNGQRVAGSGLTYDAASTDNAYVLTATDTRVGGAKTQQYGMLEVAASACDRNTLGPTALSGNAAGTLSLVGANSGTPLAPGAVVNATLADGAVSNVKLASDVPRPNLLTNPTFELWQRPGPYALNGWSADRWLLGGVGTGAGTPSKDVANQEFGSACAACAVTAANGNANSPVWQANVNDMLAQLRGRACSMLFRVKAPIAATVVPAWSDGVTGGGALQFGAPVNLVAGAYATVTMTFVPANNATVLWVNLSLQTVTTFFVDRASLVLGLVAVDTPPLTPAEDLARAQRYYERLDEDGGGALIIGAPSYAAGAAMNATFSYKVTKAVTPSVTITPGWTLNNAAAQPAAPLGTKSAMRTALTSTAVGSAFYAVDNSAGNNIIVEANA